jgi:hypothetical protein
MPFSVIMSSYGPPPPHSTKIELQERFGFRFVFYKSSLQLLKEDKESIPEKRLCSLLRTAITTKL